MNIVIPQELVTQVLTDVVQLLIAVLGAYVLSFVRRYMKNDKWQKGYELAKKVVTAVEQVYGVSTDNILKKDEARIAIRKHAKQLGLRLSDDQIDTLIEVAVGELNDVWWGVDEEFSNSKSVDTTLGVDNEKQVETPGYSSLE